MMFAAEPGEDEEEFSSLGLVSVSKFERDLSVFTFILLRSKEDEGENSSGVACDG